MANFIFLEESIMWGNSDKEFSFRIIDDCDHIIDEAGNTTINLRKISWGDSDKVNLDIRKYYHTDQGERMAKGVSFLTEEGPHNLVDTMTKLGYGDTRTVLTNLKERDDFAKSLNSVMGKDSEYYDDEAGDYEDEFFDPKSLI